MSSGDRPVLIFRIGDRRFGLAVAAVESVVRMVEITPLARGPVVVHGLIDVGGELVPVFAIERRFGMPPHVWGAQDFLILARAARGRVALAAQEVIEVREAGDDWVEKGEIGVPAEPVAGVVRTPDGLILIQNLDTFLVAAEAEQLEEALRDQE